VKIGYGVSLGCAVDGSCYAEEDVLVMMAPPLVNGSAGMPKTDRPVVFSLCFQANKFRSHRRDVNCTSAKIGKPNLIGTIHISVLRQRFCTRSKVRGCGFLS
jgi:hypothetical protein